MLLTRLDANDAGLRGDGGQVHSVALAALGAVWQGEFATLWRAPAQYAGLVMEGSAGPAVDWLATRLAALQSQPAPPDKQRFGAALKARVNAFQVAQGLLADGIAGPTTLMQLNRASGVDEPRLPDAAAAAATR